MIRFTKKGITFNYNNDELTWLWWWSRPLGIKYLSLVYDRGFETMKHYWIWVGATDVPLSIPKVKGYSTEDLILAWVKLNFRHGHIVVLFNINVESKPASFWRSIPDRDKMQLLSDVVVLKCKNWEEVKALCESINTEFAYALGFSNGQMICQNEDDK